LLPPSQGTVLLGGHPLRRLLPSERVRRGLRIGFVFQDGGLFANMDTYTNVSLPLYYHKEILGFDDQTITHRTEEVLDLAQVEKRHWRTLPAHLSFGDRKRLALARALAIEPNYFFFDDPDIGMDQRTASVTHKVLCQLRDEKRVTLLLATNRSKLLDRLGIEGFQFENGLLSDDHVHSVAPSGWSIPPRLIIP
jgi:phospholipid/cholesterol/gamma-HCH transport system ATP-binding protein